MARGITKAQVEEMRRLYCHSKTSVSAIAKKLGVSIETVRRHIRSKAWPLRRTVVTQTGKSTKNKASSKREISGESNTRKSISKCVGLAQCTERPELIGRVWAAALSQIEELEKRTKSLGSRGQKSLARASDDARAIAILVRTLKDLMALDNRVDGGVCDKKKTDAAEQAGDQKGWSSLADDLARRLAGLRKRRTLAESPRGDGG
ncbi:MAG: hypothetical protein WCO61_09785 [Alphaproteobacteria bacterium]